MTNIALPDWPRALGTPHAVATLRRAPEDFRVDEQLGFAPDGEGEHVLVHIRKRNRNTVDVARGLARHAGVRERDVSFGGLKDRNAVTSQWFSVWLPGRETPDWSAIESDDLQVLVSARHRRKLQRGTLTGNAFEIVLRDVTGDHAELEHRLHAVAQRGVPNYFGEQRFGRDGGNVQKAADMFNGRRVKDRELRGLLLSAARSFLFNEVLAVRVQDGTWQRILSGEAAMLAGKHSFFLCDAPDDDIERRCLTGDIHPSGPLWGKEELPTRGPVRELEEGVAGAQPLFAEGLAKADLRQERRALRLPVGDFHWEWIAQADLRLRFNLPAGAYATAVLRELVSSPAVTP